MRNGAAYGRYCNRVGRTADAGPCTRRRVALSMLALAAAALGGCDSRGEAPGAGHVRAVIGEVGASPGQFSYPRAIDVEPDGNRIWVIDKTARVQRIDVRTGRCDAGWRMPDFEFGKPTGVTVGRWTDGRAALYVPDTHYHRVLVYDISEIKSKPAPVLEAESAPRLLAKIGTYGRGPGEFIYPTDVAVLPGSGSPVARLYISEYGEHDRINIFEPTGDADPVNAFRFVSSFGSFGEGADPGAVEFNRPQSIAIDLDARELIITDACNHRLGRFTLDGALIGWVGGPGTAPGRFAYPYGLVRLGDGTVLVSEYGNNRVQRIDPRTGESRGMFSQSLDGAIRITTPWGVAVDQSEAYVLDSRSNRVIGIDVPGGPSPVAAGAGRRSGAGM